MHPFGRTAAAVAVLFGCMGCSDARAPQEAAARARTLPHYETEIRWTSHGIPHVRAANWGSLGYGFAYATARDAVCTIARDVVTVNGDLSRHFGAGISDF